MSGAFITTQSSTWSMSRNRREGADVRTRIVMNTGVSCRHFLWSFSSHPYSILVTPGALHSCRRMQSELLLLTALHWPAVQAGPDRRKLAVPASSSLALVCLCDCLIRHTQSNLIDYRSTREELIVITKTASTRIGFQAPITHIDLQPVKQTASFTAVRAQGSATGGNKHPAKDD
jgi:hypothetical protein